MGAAGEAAPGAPDAADLGATRETEPGGPGAADVGLPSAAEPGVPAEADPGAPGEADVDVPDDAGPEACSEGVAGLGEFAVPGVSSDSVEVSKKSKERGGEGTREACTGAGAECGPEAGVEGEAAAAFGAEPSPKDRNPPPSVDGRPGEPGHSRVDGGPTGWGGTAGTTPRGGPAGRGGTVGAASAAAYADPDSDANPDPNSDPDANPDPREVGGGSSADQSSPPDRDGSGDRVGFGGVGPADEAVRPARAPAAGGVCGTGGWAGAAGAGGPVGAGGVWEAAGAPAGGAVGRRGFEARRASVLMHPPFPRTGLSAAPELGEPSRHVREEDRHGHAYPRRWTVTPGRARRGKVVPPCVRVTLRVDARPAGTSTSPRGICPERPPTLR